MAINLIKYFNLSKDFQSVVLIFSKHLTLHKGIKYAIKFFCGEVMYRT